MNVSTKLILGLFGGLVLSVVLYFFLFPPYGALIGYFLTLALFLFMGGYLAVNLRQAFWKVAQSKDVMLVLRRDGFFEMASAEYYTGWLKTKFGFHLMTDKNKELTTGKNVSIALDMWGPTIRPDDLAAVEEFAKHQKIQSPQELEKLLNNWHKCSKCDWEGIPEPETKEKVVKVGGIEQKETEVIGKLCGAKKCDGKNDDLVLTPPNVLTPFYKTVSLEPARLLMKHSMNPSKAVVLADRLMRIKMGMSAKMTEFILRMFGIGIAALFICSGIGLMLKLSGVV